jgi:hypothetical protein
MEHTTGLLYWKSDLLHISYSSVPVCIRTFVFYYITCRILQALIGISRYFLELPNHREKGMCDYYDVISKPVCFRESECFFVIPKSYNNLLHSHWLI